MLRSTFLSVALMLALLAPGQAMAHEGADPLIHVPLDHVLPGVPFPVIGADLGPGAKVSFVLSRGDRVVPLGGVTAGPDGHFNATLTAPATLADGYAQLRASGSDGSDAETWILVGERTEATAAPPGRTTSGRDRTAVLVAIVLAGAGVALAVWAVRAARRERRVP